MARLGIGAPLPIGKREVSNRIGSCFKQMTESKTALRPRLSSGGSIWRATLA